MNFQKSNQCGAAVGQSQGTILNQISPAVKNMYRTIHRHTGMVGGYGHHGAIYGEVTMGSFHKIVTFLRKHVDFDSSSSFLDIGAGLGKPNFHVLLDPGVRFSIGVELESLRFSLSLYNLSHVIKEVAELNGLSRKPNIMFMHNDITVVDSFNPLTHIYSFDVGFPPAALEAISAALKNSVTVKAFVSFHKPREIIDQYDFPVDLVGSVNTTMHGSSEGHKAYVYRHRRHYKDVLHRMMYKARTPIRKKKCEQDNNLQEQEEEIEDCYTEASSVKPLALLRADSDSSAGLDGLDGFIIPLRRSKRTLAKCKSQRIDKLYPIVTKKKYQYQILTEQNQMAKKKKKCPKKETKSGKLGTPGKRTNSSTSNKKKRKRITGGERRHLDPKQLSFSREAQRIGSSPSKLPDPLFQQGLDILEQYTSESDLESDFHIQPDTYDIWIQTQLESFFSTARPVRNKKKIQRRF